MPRYKLPSDEEVAEFVRTHPGGGTLEEVGAVLGVTRERVRQLEEQALRHAMKLLTKYEISASDLSVETEDRETGPGFSHWDWMF